MEESNAKRRPKHAFRQRGRYTEPFCHLRKWISTQGRNVPSQFLRGAAYKLGSGAVSLLILWWETHH